MALVNKKFGDLMGGLFLLSFEFNLRVKNWLYGYFRLFCD